MNHLGDTNKMVYTPRTDKVTRIYGDASVEWEEELVPVDACRAIERELNAANQRIKRLEEAGDALANHHLLVVTTYDKAKTHVSDWNKAKEDKL